MNLNSEQEKPFTTKRTKVHEGNQFLAEGWQFQQIVFGNLFHRLSSFTPRRQSAADDKCAKALLS
jgi:hypothetical protein